jgi:hypothetical protein
MVTSDYHYYHPSLIHWRTSLSPVRSLSASPSSARTFRGLFEPFQLGLYSRSPSTDPYAHVAITHDRIFFRPATVGTGNLVVKHPVDHTCLLASSGRCRRSSDRNWFLDTDDFGPHFTVTAHSAARGTAAGWSVVTVDHSVGKFCAQNFRPSRSVGS